MWQYPSADLNILLRTYVPAYSDIHSDKTNNSFKPKLFHAMTKS